MQEELKSEAKAEAEDGAVIEEAGGSQDEDDVGSVNGAEPAEADDAVSNLEQAEDDGLTAEKYDELNDRYLLALAEAHFAGHGGDDAAAVVAGQRQETGRASCRERV